MSSLAALMVLVFSAAGVAFLIGGAGAMRQRRAARADPRAQPPTAERAGLEYEIRSALDQELPLATGRFTRLEIAVQPGLAVHWDRDALSRALRLVVRNAFDRAEGGRVLVTASRHGGRVLIAVSDDAEPGDRELTEAMLREPEQVLALLGATMDVTPQADCGTTIAIRLPEPGPISGQPRQQTSSADADRAALGRDDDRRAVNRTPTAPAGTATSR